MQCVQILAIKASHFLQLFTLIARDNYMKAMSINLATKYVNQFWAHELQSHNFPTQQVFE